VESVPVMSIILPALMVLLGIGAAFLVFCCAFVWRLPWMPTRWGDVAWKRVDYVWIIAGSVALVIQAVTMNGDSKSLELNTEKSFLRMSAQSANMDAAKLSDSEICLPVTSDNGSVRDESMIELDEACKQFKKIRPDNAIDQILDVKLNPYLYLDHISDRGYKNAELKERIQRLNQSLDYYSAQREVVQNLSNQVNQYKITLKVMMHASYVMLALAVGLRLAKVKGEITLKSNPISKKEEDYVSREELSLAVEGLISRNQLKALEQKIGNLELLVRRVIYCAGGLIVMAVLFACYMFLISSR
jgi:hypothetical protein